MLTELSTLVAQRPALRDGLAVAAAALADAVGSPAGQASGRFRYGLDLVAWADDPDAAPPPSYLRTSGVSYPLILVTQALLWRALWEDGLRDAMRSGAIIAASGHSQGLLAALLVAEAGPRGIDDALLARYARLAWTIGTHAARCAYPGAQAPLAAVSGVRRARLEPLLHEINGLVARDAGAAIALVNAPQRIVVGGPPATLGLLHARLATQARDEQRARRDGSRGGAPLRFTWTDLDVDVAFHTAALTSARDELLGTLRATPGLLPDPADLTIASPVAGGRRRPAPLRRHRRRGRDRAARRPRALGSRLPRARLSRRAMDPRPRPRHRRQRADRREPPRSRRRDARARVAGGPPQAQLARRPPAAP